MQRDETMSVRLSSFCPTMYTVGQSPAVQARRMLHRNFHPNQLGCRSENAAWPISLASPGQPVMPPASRIPCSCSWHCCSSYPHNRHSSRATTQSRAQRRSDASQHRPPPQQQRQQQRHMQQQHHRMGLSRGRHVRGVGRRATQRHVQRRQQRVCRRRWLCRGRCGGSGRRRRPGSLLPPARPGTQAMTVVGLAGQERVCLPMCCTSSGLLEGGC